MQPRKAKKLETEEPKRLESKKPKIPETKKPKIPETKKPKRQLETGGVNNMHTKFSTLKTTKFSQVHDGFAVNLYY